MRGFRTAAQLALALLAAGCVLLAVAGPRLALASRTDALRRLLAGTPPSATSLRVSASWNDIASDQAQAYGTGLQQGALTDAEVSGMTSQLHDYFTTGLLHPTPVSQAWAGMTTNELDVADLLPSLHGQGAQLELIYRTPFTRYAALAAGRYPGLPNPAPSSRTTPANSVALDVAVSQATAARFGLRPGSVVRLKAPNLGSHVQVQLRVTGVIKPRLPGSTFWTTDPTAAQPTQIVPLTGSTPYWIGAVFVAPAEAVLLQQSFGPRLAATWMLPLTFPGIRGDQAQPLYDALNRATSQAPALSGKLAPASDALQVSSGLLSPLRGFLATAAAISTLQWLLAASLAVAALATLLLAGWMVALRRDPELSVLRARGASLRQVGWVVLRDAAAACVPAALLASAVALLAVPGETPSGSLAWWPAVAVALVAACGPAVAGAWRQRLPRRRRAGRRSAARVRMTGRLVAEVTVCALAIAALVVLREQGESAANLFTSAVPALVAIPVVIVVQRLYPLVLRGSLRIAARRRGATAFLALAGATRTALTPALPTFALVVALTVAAFGGMTRDAIGNGEIAASWRAVGADVTIIPGAEGNGALGPEVINGMIQPDVIKAITSVPGVQHAAGVYVGALDTPDGQQITAIAVDPASYAALVGSERGYWPPFPAGLLGGAGGAPGRHSRAAAVPALASPDIAAALGNGTVTLDSQVARPVSVRVAGVIASTPALPDTGSFVLLPISALRPISEPVEPNLLLLTGPDIDRAALATVLSKDLAGGVATFRSDELRSLADAPLQHGTYDLLDVAIVACAVLGLTVLLLVLALGATGRELTLARLATMGLSAPQRAWLVALEVGPAVLAAAMAGIACALLLPPELGPVIDLSVFTGGPPGTAQPGSIVAVPFAADAAAIGLPIAALGVLAGIALLIETRAWRRRGAYGIAPLMRGE